MIGTNIPAHEHLVAFHASVPRLLDLFTSPTQTAQTLATSYVEITYKFPRHACLNARRSLIYHDVFDLAPKLLLLPLSNDRNGLQFQVPRTIMKSFRSRLLATAGLVTGLLVASSSAMADWTFGGVDGGAATTSYSDGTTNLNISGAYATNGASKDQFASGAKWSNAYVSSTANATVEYYLNNGLGMSSDGKDAPNHAIDNAPTAAVAAVVKNGVIVTPAIAATPGNTEAVVLNFSSSVVLTSIGIGYTSGDSDISLFRYTGKSAPAVVGVGADKASMLAAGWSLVGNYGDLAVDKANPYNPVNSGSVGSSWWLITAYNASYGAATTGTVNQGDDFFKIYALAGAVCTTGAKGNSSDCGYKVPEPASLALVGVGLIGIFSSKRRARNVRAVVS